MGALDGFTPVKSAGAGIALSVVNPKNLLLIVGGAAAVAQTDASGTDQTVAWIVFTIVASIGVAAPLVTYVVMGERAGPVLDRMKARMAHNNATIMAVLCLIIGVKLIGDAIAGWSA
jgi:threonine/homoserine/homoserine lactone efflux protein